MTFDAQQAGTTAAEWAASEALRRSAPESAEEFAALVVVAAHPDDETLMAGGLIARFASSGRPVTINVATDGEGSHAASTTVTPEALARRRTAEVVAAAQQLGVKAPPVRLQLPDGQVGEHVTAVSDAVAHALTPGCLVVSTWERDGHPDHEAVARAARRALRRTPATHWQAPIWLWHWGDPADGAALSALSRIELSRSERRRKSSAMAAFTSQIAPLSDLPGDEAVLLPEVLQHFEGSAEFFIAETSADSSTSSLGQEFFDDFYSGGDDPWGFETRWYEQRKRDITMASLPRERFSSALELGCSIGVTTVALADRVDSLLALDIADKPLEVARRRLDGVEHVRFERRTLPDEWPTGTYDLIVMSEMGHYLAVDDLTALIGRCRDALAPDGVILACHWRHPVAEYPLDGDTVHALLAEIGLTRTVQHVEKDFRLEVFSADSRSVAEAVGLA